MQIKEWVPIVNSLQFNFRGKNNNRDSLLDSVY